MLLAPVRQPFVLRYRSTNGATPSHSRHLNSLVFAPFTLTPILALALRAGSAVRARSGTRSRYAQRTLS